MDPKAPKPATNKTAQAKTSLLDELKAIRGSLDNKAAASHEADDIPVLTDDEEDIPLLGNIEDIQPLDDDDVPVLTSVEDAANKASLADALRQLESMELAPKAKPKPAKQPLTLALEEHQPELAAHQPASAVASKPIPDLAEKIRANAAAAPAAESEEKPAARENPFFRNDQMARLDQSKKLNEQVKAGNKPASPTKPAEENLVEEKGAIDFHQTTAPLAQAAAAPVAADEEEDGADEILKLLDEKPQQALEEELDIDAELADIDQELSSLGELTLMDEKDYAATKPATPAPARPAAVAAKPAAANVPPARTEPAKAINKQAAADIDKIIDEVVDEYMMVLEAALRKKLKEKLPSLLK